MRVLCVSGSRGWTDRERVRQVLAEYTGYHVITGGAKGVDAIAEEEAGRMGMSVTVYPADWKQHGKSAGFKRNVKMVEEADEVIAFWDGQSRGTKHTINEARKRGLPVRVFREVSNTGTKPE